MTKLKLKSIGFLSLACAVLAIVFLMNTAGKTLSTVFAQQNNKTQQQDDPRKKGLKVGSVADVADEAAPSTSPLERKKRDEKNRRYDAKIGTGKIRGKLTTGDSDEGITVSANTSEKISELPVPQSEIIVLGTINAVQPYLTESETAIYTEFTFQTENILKNTTGGKLSEGDLIKADQEAGAIRLASGKIIRYEVEGKTNLPRLGKRYVLFLKQVNDGKDINIVTSYELRDGKVLTPEGGKVFSPETGIITKKSPFADLSESDFLQIIRNAIANTTTLSNDGGGK